MQEAEVNIKEKLSNHKEGLKIAKRRNTPTDRKSVESVRQNER